MAQLLAVWLGQTYACLAMCSCLAGPLAEELKHSDAVFLGRITWIETTTTQGRWRPDGPIGNHVLRRRIHFSVSSVWKGPRDSQIVVKTGGGGGDCGLEGLAIDQDWIVFADRRGRDFVTGICSRTGLAETRHSLIDSLGTTRKLH